MSDEERWAQAFLRAYAAATPTVRHALMDSLDALVGIELLCVDAEGNRHYLAQDMARALGVTVADVLAMERHSPGIVIVNR